MRAGCSANDVIRLGLIDRALFATGVRPVLHAAVSEWCRNHRTPMLASCCKWAVPMEVPGIPGESAGRADECVRVGGMGGVIPLITLYTSSIQLSHPIPAAPRSLLPRLLVGDCVYWRSWGFSAPTRRITLRQQTLTSLSTVSLGRLLLSVGLCQREMLLWIVIRPFTDFRHYLRHLTDTRYLALVTSLRPGAQTRA